LYLTDYSSGTEYQTLIVKEGNITDPGFYREASLIFYQEKKKGGVRLHPFLNALHSKLEMILESEEYREAHSTRNGG
jgi:hypothetical protein